MRIALATCSAWPNLCADDQRILPILKRRGVDAIPVAWDCDKADWSTFDCVVIRSIWDYHKRIREFKDWLDRLDEAAVPCWNPTSLIRWNRSKSYLRDLKSQGFLVVPTHWPIRESPIDLATVMRERNWPRIVVKPTISASGDDTYLIGDPASGQSIVDALQKSGEIMIQPFVDVVEREGEWSLIYLGNRYSHAVRKLAAPGEFRVQEEHGGTNTVADAPEELRRDAEAILAAIGQSTLYARVDGFEIDRRLVLGELELIEPLLFLSYSEKAAENFSLAILEVIGGRV